MTLYTVALLVRTVADGLGAVPDSTRQAAIAMGYSRLRAAARASTCRSPSRSSRPACGSRR